MNENIKKKLFEEVKKRGLVVEQKSGTSDFTEMISLILHSRTQIHILHLQTKSFAEHKVLNEYYDEIGDLVDGLVESSVNGVNGFKLLSDDSESVVDGLGVSKVNIVEYPVDGLELGFAKSFFLSNL
jgi:hypothetical protein